ncbi:MAG: peptide deformylase [Melioribacter sp.]|uniref:peptide deformylase n=1 Tax=Melioribacter sp. TaxID=2052167 RepID=UPI003BC14164
MAVLPIKIYGSKILRQKAKKIEQIDDTVIDYIRNMFETMRKAYGVGLAANQVGVDKSIFVIDLKDVEGYEKFKPLVMINPEIIEESDEFVSMEEGCLSLPTLRADVERPKEIKVRYLDTDENIQEMEASDFLARVILHEYDHLIGKMIPDRVADEVKKQLKEQLEKIRKKEVEIDYPVSD